MDSLSKSDILSAYSIESQVLKNKKRKLDIEGSYFKHFQLGGKYMNEGEPVYKWIQEIRTFW